MRPVQKGKYRAEAALTPEARAEVLGLRGLVFVGAGRSDIDAMDAACVQVGVRNVQTGALVCAYRLLLLPNGAAIAHSYSAQFYDLAALYDYAQPMAEVGRFCLHPDHHDPDILRVAWGAMAGFVDQYQVGLLFGCCSFKGDDPAGYRNALAHLCQNHLAPALFAPRPKAPEIHKLMVGQADLRAALQEMPTLLRSYLAMGGWVSDHAVIDRDLGTFHVFTAVEIAAVPPARARLLRALSG
jgi:putative hemolysin